MVDLRPHLAQRHLGEVVEVATGESLLEDVGGLGGNPLLPPCLRQGANEGYQPVLTIEPVAGASATDFASALQRALPAVREAYPGVDARRLGDRWQVVAPASYHVGHEAHFAQVAQAFLRYVEEGALPAWEVPDMIAKYATTTRALEMARSAP